MRTSARSLLPRFVALLVFWLILEGAKPLGLLIGIPTAALATWLAIRLIPLLFDVFFGAMAVTIVVGLLFASALTLLVVPVLYAVFFKVRPEKEPISRYEEAGAPSRA